MSEVVLNGTGAAWLALLLLDRCNARARSTCDVLHDLIGFALDLESRSCMIRRELQVLMAEITLDDPIVFRHERQTFTFTRHDERERGGLHTTRRAYVAITCELHERKVAREHRSPK